MQRTDISYLPDVFYRFRFSQIYYTFRKFRSRLLTHAK